MVPHGRCFASSRMVRYRLRGLEHRHHQEAEAKISALEIEEALQGRTWRLSECASSAWTIPNGDSASAQRSSSVRQRATLEDLREMGQGADGASKIPRELVCVAQLPRNAMGKVVKPGVATFFAPPAPPARQEP